jgi:hypothetical protein
MSSGTPFPWGKGKNLSSAAIQGFDLGKAAQSVSQLIPVLRGLVRPETQLRQKYQGANLAEMGAFLRGLLPMSRQAGMGAARQLQDIREKELLGMRGDTGITRSLLARLSPEAAAQVQASEQAAQAAEQAARGLTGQEMRTVQQQAREAAAASGRLGGNAAIASELLGRDVMLGQKRAEAQQARQQAFGLGQQFYSQPGLELLGRQPVSSAMALNLLQQGIGSIGEGTPKLFDPSLGINLGLAQLNALTGLESAYMTKNAAERAGNIGLLGDAIGSIASMFQFGKKPGQ